MDKEVVKRLQAEAMAKLEADLAKAEADTKVDLVKGERRVLGFEVARLRYKRNISQAKLAVKAGVRQADISRIEGGKANPSLNTLLKITKALGADLMLE
ncbi:MAG TPA: helix-turn-helix transcriptional regulator [Candidatus Saccharimonadales bacterium]|jgi:DNA-binding XRE family transcriptional regulator|nr:helix-turn-helix transcriptional regulator [Candidatus Saccharimonadales bacterium]